MPVWNSDQYLRFASERTRPCRELAARIDVPSPRQVIDLGCGPGNSTKVLSERWPDATLTGLDSSTEMLSAARQSSPSVRWILRDIADWAARAEETYDVVFSNAALQWVSDHALTYPRVLARVAPGGALAIQVPNNSDAPAHCAARRIAASPEWCARFPKDGVREWHVHEREFYYDLLAPHSARIDLWETEYVHVMPGPETILEWYKGTGLRPFLEALPSPADQERYCAEYLEGVRQAYPPRPDGYVLFPFRRLFLVAYRAG